MKQEERDIYVIPPNFIEGGTLLGGMFKTHNVIEAGILAVVTGLPIMSLNLSLTVRIIILCLTALPLVLVALIGASGTCLSEFVLQFFNFLRNRRVLTRDGLAETSKRKSLQPSWVLTAGKRQEDGERETPLKSRNRLQFDVKERKVTQHKIFLPREEEMRPLNFLAEYVPIDKIENGIIYTEAVEKVFSTASANLKT